MTSPTITRPEKESTSTLNAHPGDAHERVLIARFLSNAILIVLVGLFAAELLGRFVVFSSKPANSTNPQYDTKYRVAGSLNPTDTNIVLCGDSLMKEGVYPELITAKLKKRNQSIRVSNLAVTGGNQLDAVQYLNYLKQRNVKPKLVVFDFEVSNTCLPTMANNIDWGQTHSYLFRGLLSRPKGLKEVSQIAPSDAFYLVRQRANIKKAFCDFFSALPSTRAFAQKSFYEPTNSPQLEVSESGMAPNNQVADKIDWSEEKRKIGFFTPFCPQSATYKYNPYAYSIIVDYCQQQQIPLLLVWLPHQKKIYDTLFYKAPYDEAWHRQQFENYSKRPFVSTEYLNVLPDDCIYFHDYRHLNTYGCVKTSELLADALNKPQYKPLLGGSQ